MEAVQELQAEPAAWTAEQHYRGGVMAFNLKSGTTPCMDRVLYG